MRLNLKLLNLFIGMCKGAAGLPGDLRRLGFQDRAVEMRFQNANREPVVPELIIASRQLHHALLFEWKQGANTEAEQLRRYSGVTQQDLVQRVFLAPEECAAHDVTIICLEEHRDRIVLGVQQGGYNFPVLTVTATGLLLAHNRFAVNETDALFRAGLEIDWGKTPTSFFPIDAESELWEIAEQVLRELVLRMSKGATRILAEEIAQTIVPHWHTANEGFRRQISPKITQILDHAALRDFSRYITRNRPAERVTHFPTWDVIDNPLVNEPDKRLKVWRDFLKRQSSVIAYFQAPERQGQLPLAAPEPQQP